MFLILFLNVFHTISLLNMLNSCYLLVYRKALMRMYPCPLTSVSLPYLPSRYLQQSRFDEYLLTSLYRVFFFCMNKFMDFVAIREVE
jgi:hypothetical protein